MRSLKKATKYLFLTQSLVIGLSLRVKLLIMNTINLGHILLRKILWIVKEVILIQEGTPPLTLKKARILNPNLIYLKEKKASFILMKNLSLEEELHSLLSKIKNLPTILPTNSMLDT